VVSRSRGNREAAIASLERAHGERAVEFAQMQQYPPFTTIPPIPAMPPLCS
jgi:hypothetical protein